MLPLEEQGLLVVPQVRLSAKGLVNGKLDQIFIHRFWVKGEKGQKWLKGWINFFLRSPKTWSSGQNIIAP